MYVEVLSVGDSETSRVVVLRDPMDTSLMFVRIMMMMFIMAEDEE